MSLVKFTDMIFYSVFLVSGLYDLLIYRKVYLGLKSVFYQHLHVNRGSQYLYSKHKCTNIVIAAIVYNLIHHLAYQ